VSSQCHAMQISEKISVWHPPHFHFIPLELEASEHPPVHQCGAFSI
jgi:hypothetical protein